MGDDMDWLSLVTPENIAIALGVVAQVVGSFALIATMTPNKSDDKIVQKIIDVVNILGANVGNAANKKE